jgi:hypothetical protein
MWGNSVLNAALWPRVQLQDPPPVYFRRLACHPTPAFTLCASLNLFWVLVALMGGWLVAPLLLSAFAAFPAFHWEFGTESLAPCSTPVLWGRFSVPPSLPLVVLDYSLLFMFFNFAEWGSVCPGAVLDYFPVGWVGELHVVPDAHLFILLIHTSSFRAGCPKRMVLLFSVQSCIGRLSMG